MEQKKVLTIFFASVTVLAFLFSMMFWRLTKRSEPNVVYYEPSDNGTPTSSFDFGIDAAIASLVRSLSSGKVVFNPPSDMTTGVSSLIEVRIASTLSADLAKGLKGLGKAQIENIQVGPLMAVTLSGEDAFEIKPLTPKDQFVAKDIFTEWSYNVLPLESGIHRLYLSIGVRLAFGNNQEQRLYPLMEREVKVRVNLPYTTKRFFSRNWQWVGTALILPLIALWWKRRSENRKKREEPRILPATDSDLPNSRLR